MNPIRFHLPIIPPTATSQNAGKRMFIPKDSQGRVTGRPMFFKNKASKSAEHDLLLLLSQFVPAKPLTGPIALSVDFVWPFRKSEPAWRKALGRVHHTSQPDGSNAIKQIEDCMTKLQFWEDDSQIADLHISKAWGDHIGISVEIRQLEDPPRQPAKRKQAQNPDEPSLL